MTDQNPITPEFVSKIAVKLPDFWTEDPDLWFLHAESVFRNAQITQSQTKFDHVIQKLPQAIMVSVRSLIMPSASSSTSPYEDLKAKLVSSYTLTRWQRVAKVIHHPALGDHCLTAMMDSMLALLPEDEVPGSLFLGLFLEHLPVEMRDHLVAQDLALHADKLWDARRVQPVDPLLAAATFPSNSPSRSRGRGSLSPVRRSQTPGPTSAAEGYFHRRFGANANNSRPPCSFRETPEPTGGGGIKQPSRRQFAHLSTRCFNKSSVPGGYRSLLFCFSSSLVCSPDWSSSPYG